MKSAGPMPHYGAVLRRVFRSFPTGPAHDGARGAPELTGRG